ncbi:hypothetical protein B1218_36220, partial [Pseudomonas ogarae]
MGTGPGTTVGGYGDAGGGGGEGRGRVRRQGGRARLWGCMPAGDDPQGRGEAQGLEIIRAVAFPVVVLEQFAVMIGQRAAGQQGGRGQYAGRLGAAFEQGQQVGVG